MDNLPQRTHFEAGPNVSIIQKFPILIAECPFVNIMVTKTPIHLAKHEM